MTSKRYALVVESDDEGVVDVWVADPPLTYNNANEAQAYVRRQVPFDHSVTIVPARLIPSTAALLDGKA